MSLKPTPNRREPTPEVTTTYNELLWLFDRYQQDVLAEEERFSRAVALAKTRVRAHMLPAFERKQEARANRLEQRAKDAAKRRQANQQLFALKRKTSPIDVDDEFLDEQDARAVIASEERAQSDLAEAAQTLKAMDHEEQQAHLAALRGLQHRLLEDVQAGHLAVILADPVLTIRPVLPPRDDVPDHARYRQQILDDYPQFRRQAGHVLNLHPREQPVRILSCFIEDSWEYQQQRMEPEKSPALIELIEQYQLDLMAVSLAETLVLADDRLIPKSWTAYAWSFAQAIMDSGNGGYTVERTREHLQQEQTQQLAQEREARAQQEYSQAQTQEHGQSHSQTHGQTHSHDRHFGPKL